MLIKILLFLIIFSVSQCSSSDDRSSRIRPPTVAGQFYPDDPERLTNAIEYYLESAKTAFSERPVAILAPHAGYIYSGQIAADAFRQAQNFEYDVIVVLGTNHTTGSFRGVSIYAGNGFQTPLGVTEIDQKLAKELIALDEDITFHEGVHISEHSIEVQIPFIQTLFPDVPILPVVVGRPDLDLCSRFGEALAQTLKNRQPLIVASSDFSHYPDYDDAVKVDRKTLAAAITLDPEHFQSIIWQQEAKGIPNLSTCACGAAPIMVSMIAAKRLGATSARQISYANSGQAAVGDYSRVVGYGAVAFYEDEPEILPEITENEGKNISEELSEKHKIALLKHARRTIEQYLVSDTAPIANGFDTILQKRQGAFVTLNKNHQLRGCIGHMQEDRALCQVVGSMALQAAFNDRRFNPVRNDEMTEIEIEISVLTPFQPIESIDEFVIGRDGIILKKQGRSAVYLPQVAPEQGWNKEQTLEHLCQKAGLPSGSWKNNAQLFNFQAIVFSESEFTN